MNTKVRTVIIPSAGKGTRLLPATQVTAKELLPVYDMPVIQFAVDEAVEAGAERIVIVISAAKTAIRDYLEVGLNGRLDAGMASGKPVEILYAFQDRPLGLGHAVACAKDMVLSGPFGVILPDDVIMGTPCMAEMAQHYERGQMVAGMKVGLHEARQYGIFKLSGLPNDRCIPVTGIVEKPNPGKAPSSIAAVGRYILDPMIFGILAHTPAGAGGEVQLSDAITIATMAIPLTAFRFSGVRYDCGNHDGLLAAAVARQAVVKGGAVTPAFVAAQSLGQIALTTA